MTLLGELQVGDWVDAFRNIHGGGTLLLWVLEIIVMLSLAQDRMLLALLHYSDMP